MIENEYYNTADLVDMLGISRNTIKVYMLENKIPMYDNSEEIKKEGYLAGFKWDKDKFDTWKLEVWDKQYKQK